MKIANHVSFSPVINILRNKYKNYMLSKVFKPVTALVTTAISGQQIESLCFLSVLVSINYRLVLTDRQEEVIISIKI